jgi:mono/diheme cytochrome c family protein/plastocyanin
VGFLAVTFVALFVIGYYFYELGLPGDLTQSRLSAQEEAQQVTSVERGYNIYQANCASCHGVNGEGGKGPTLNRQDKLFDHLNRAYLANILEVGGRYACGTPNSIMPVWSNTGNPPGPLNYKAIEDLINFLRAEKGEEYRVLNPELVEPVIDPATGEEKTFEGWVDPAYEPEPGATPYPACWSDEFASPSSAPSSPTPSGEPGATQAPSGTVLKISAQNVKFDTDQLSAPADADFQIEFTNNDAGIQHNVEIRDANGKSLFMGDIFVGVETRTYTVPALPAGTYTFVCTVHPNMTGTLTVGG